MKETIERTLWAILLCLLCIILAFIITSSMLFPGSGKTVAQLSPVTGAESVSDRSQTA